MSVRSIISAFFLCSSIISVSQEAVRVYTLEKNMSKKVAHINNEKGAKAGNDTIWHEDFGGGMPSGWESVDETGNNWLWIWSTQEPTSAWDVGSGPINSTTGDNGFLIYNAAEFSGGTMPSMNAYFTTTSIDCSSAPTVILKFEQRFRWCCTEAAFLVQVSSNDFATFEEFDVSYNTPANIVTEDPDLVELNISSIAANQSNVKIRFRWTTVSHYYWMIDDILLSTAYDHDLQLTETNLDFFYTNGGYFSEIPANQSVEIFTSGIVRNFGSNDETNSIFGCSINGGEENLASIALLFPSFAVDTLQTNNFYPTNTGSYEMAFSILSDNTDDNPVNNYDTVNFQLTNGSYSRIEEINTSIGISSVSSLGDGAIFGINIFVANEFHVDEVSVFVSPISDAYASIRAVLFDEDQAIIATSDYHEIQPSEIGTWVTLPINSGSGNILIPDPGSIMMYIAGIEIYENGGTFYMGADNTYRPNAMNTSVLYHPDDFTWYYLQKTPAIRVSQACTIDLTSDISNVSCYGHNDGTISTEASSDNPPFSYSWSNFSSNSVIGELYAGLYLLSVTDASGCLNTFSFEVLEPAELSMSIIVNPVSESGFCNGNIIANGLGGISPYYYLWDDSSTANILSNVCEGAHYITITDDNDCVFSSGITIGVLPDAIIITDSLYIFADTCFLSSSMPVDSAYIIDVIETASGIDIVWIFWQAGLSDTAYFSYNEEFDYVTSMVYLTITCSEAKSGEVYYFADYFDFSILLSKPAIIYEGFNIYPNPSNGIITVEQKDIPDIANIVIIDNIGNKVFEKQNLTTKNTINISHLSKGVYYLILETGNKKYREKVVIQ
ncbi:MAG: T9SS type A sorting domain-containing protein [Bacteroidales bacterium]|nr:T9SS type A sorting domain-containing protein [Bacteroidales bacterium]